jgi:DNA-binding IclR family transcriptional regulator
VAAPIEGADDEVLGAISVSGPTTRMKSERFGEEIPERTLDAANVVQLSIEHA